jgi:hypothetical protein
MARTITVNFREDASTKEMKQLIERARKLGDVVIGSAELRRLLGELTPEEKLCAEMSDREVFEKLEAIRMRQREGNFHPSEMDMFLMLEANRRGLWEDQRKPN